MHSIMNCAAFWQTKLRVIGFSLKMFFASFRLEVGQP